MKLISRYIFMVLLSMTLFASVGCSTISNINEAMPWHSANEVKTLGISVSYDNQLQHAISVDVVFVYDIALAGMLTSASAIQWFDERPGYLASYSQNLDVIHREIVPGYNEVIDTLPDRHSDAIAVLAFAYYPLNPNTKADLTLLATPWLVFDSQQMQVLTIPPGVSTGD